MNSISSKCRRSHLSCLGGAFITLTFTTHSLVLLKPMQATRLWEAFLNQFFSLGFFFVLVLQCMIHSSAWSGIDCEVAPALEQQKGSQVLGKTQELHIILMQVGRLGRPRTV
jgi:hypothetical protein